jgi:hypothetical protein
VPQRRPDPFPLVLAAEVALLTVVPYALAYLTTPPGHHFMGFFFEADDATTYLAKMRSGAEGSWLWDNRYISIPSPPVLVYLFYTSWGQLAGLLHLPILLTYHLARVMGGFLLAAVVCLFATEVGLSRGARRLATTLAFFGSGFGFLAQLLGDPRVGPLQIEALDLHLPELSGFYSTMAMPHFVWAAAALLAGMLLTLRAVNKPGWRAPLLAGVAWNALAVIHPQMLLVAAAAVAAWLALRGTAGAFPGWAALGRVAVGFALVAPLLAQEAWILVHDPMVHRWSQEWAKPAPDPVSLALALGLPLVLALVALPTAWRRRARAEGLLLCWLAAGILLVYLPSPLHVQRRLLGGLYLPIAVLAALTLAAWQSRGRRAARQVRWAVVAACFSSLLVLFIAFRFALGSFPETYQTDDTVAAFHWLEQAPRGGVLASPGTGLLIPAWTGQRTYVGHYSETLDYFAKAKRAGAILDARTPAADVRAFFAEEQLRYLFWGPTERAQSTFIPGAQPDLQRVFQQGSVEVYRFKE